MHVVGLLLPSASLECGLVTSPRYRGCRTITICYLGAQRDIYLSKLYALASSQPSYKLDNVGSWTSSEAASHDPGPTWARLSALLLQLPQRFRRLAILIPCASTIPTRSELIRPIDWSIVLQYGLTCQAPLAAPPAHPNAHRTRDESIKLLRVHILLAFGLASGLGLHRSRACRRQ